mgnify:CR=1 FL=1
MALIAIGMSFGVACPAAWLAIIYDSLMWQTPALLAWTVMSIIGGIGLLSRRPK